MGLALAQLVKDSLDAWSILRIRFQTCLYRVLNRLVGHNFDLLATPFTIRRFTDAHLTQKNTKTVAIHLIKT